MNGNYSISTKVQEALIAKGVENPVIDLNNSETRKSNEEKIAIIKQSMETVMKVLGIDCTDESVEKTPKRIAKMFVEEVFSGLDYHNFPKITTIENKMKYSEVVKISEIQFTSTCEHHFIVFDGMATVSYIPNKLILGLSKFNRIVKFFAKRPQVQERLTQQIMVALQTILETEDVAVSIKATHFCVKARGVQDQSSFTSTDAFGGQFKLKYKATE